MEAVAAINVSASVANFFGGFLLSLFLATAFWHYVLIVGVIVTVAVLNYLDGKEVTKYVA